MSNINLETLKSLASTQDPETSAAASPTIEKLVPRSTRRKRASQAQTPEHRVGVVQLSVKVDEDTYARVRASASRYKLTHQDIGFIAIQEWLERNA